MNTFTFARRSRVPAGDGPHGYAIVTRQETRPADRTAVIVCDMWDLHHDRAAASRLREMAPRMNDVMEAARSRGSLIVHAATGCTEAYAGHPARRRAQLARSARRVPADVDAWCFRTAAEHLAAAGIDPATIPSLSAADPLHRTEDDRDAQQAWVGFLVARGRDPRAPWREQIDLLRIDAGDAISDSGLEIWNLLEERGIDHVILLGVHVNRCVLGRPFGLRRMAKNGKDVVLMRDLTDGYYAPPRWGNHYRRTELVVEHIERAVAATVTSDQLLGGASFSFSADAAPSRDGR